MTLLHMLLCICIANELLAIALIEIHKGAIWADIYE